MLVQRLPITQARINLGAVIRRVRLNKEYFILEQDGIPVAGIMDIDEFEDYLELRDPKIRAHIRESYRQYLAGKSRPANRSPLSPSPPPTHGSRRAIRGSAPRAGD